MCIWMIDTYDNDCVHVYWSDNGVHDWKLFMGYQIK